MIPLRTLTNAFDVSDACSCDVNGACEDCDVFDVNATCKDCGGCDVCDVNDAYKHRDVCVVNYALKIVTFSMDILN